MPWKRPENIPFPSIWHRFQAKDTDSDEIVNYVVQDLPEDRYEDAVNHMVKYFVHDEPLCKAKGIAKVPGVEEFYHHFYGEVATMKSVLVCFKEGSDEIVGVNFTKVDTIDEKDKDIQIPVVEFQEIVDCCFYVMKKYDVYDIFKIDQYLTAYGLSVTPKYRGRGIATEILKARVPFCKAFDIPLTATIFTAFMSQKAAAKAGFVDGISMAYDDLAKVDSRFYFPGIESKELKLMYLNL